LFDDSLRLNLLIESVADAIELFIGFGDEQRRCR